MPNFPREIKNMGFVSTLLFPNLSGQNFTKKVKPKIVLTFPKNVLPRASYKYLASSKNIQFLLIIN